MKSKYRCVGCRKNKIRSFTKGSKQIRIQCRFPGIKNATTQTGLEFRETVNTKGKTSTCVGVWVCECAPTHPRNHARAHTRTNTPTHVRAHTCAWTRVRTATLTPTPTRALSRKHAHARTRTRTRSQPQGHKRVFVPTHQHTHVHACTHLGVSVFFPGAKKRGW